MHVIMFSLTCSKWNWMVFQEIYASRHFQVDASSIILLRALSQMIRMKTCQSLSTRPSIGQEISMPWAPSQFWLGAIKPPRFNKKDFSFANLRISTLRFPLTPSADREGPQKVWRDAGFGYFSWWYSECELKTGAGCGNFNNQRERDFL